MRLLPLLTIAVVLGILPNANAAEVLPSPTTQWSHGSGSWGDAARWSAGAPTPFQEVEIHGASDVLLSSGTCLAGDLEIATSADDRATVTVDGGDLLLMQDSLRIGEKTGSRGEFILKSGAMHCVMDVFVGAVSSEPHRETQAALRIDGGSFVGRSLNLGIGLGAQSRLDIRGSRASAIHALDHVYLEALPDTDGLAGNCTLAFTLDENGVTPITIQSPRDGLRIIQQGAGKCSLQIALTAVPPRDDVTLLSSHVPIRGTFSDLPEGSSISAEFAGHVYRWRLTYHGGPGGNDLVLKNGSEYPADAPVTHTHPLPAVPRPLWLDHPLFSLEAFTGEPAFPGAEGFGAFTPGGRHGKECIVDNLNDAGPGSLRAAIDASGPRSITFHVGGVIPLQSTLVIREPFLTLDGGSAPGGGILLRNHGIEVRTHDIILRHLRIRIGDDAVNLAQKTSYEAGEGDYALYFVEGSRNCIADHLSMSWTVGKTLSVTKLSDLITVQWCILSESLNFADHAYASIAGGNRVTWHHNLFAHHLSRCVRFQGNVDADFRNNVIYDWGETAAYGEFDRLNYVGNYLKSGPSTTQKPHLFHNGSAVVMPGSLYVADNVMEGEPRVDQDNWRGMGYYYQRQSLAALRPFAAPLVHTESAEAACRAVLNDAGATRPTRDSVDERIVREVREGSGHIINWVKDAGGWPPFPTAAPATLPQ